MSQRSIVPAEKQQVLLSQQRTMEQRSSASTTTVRESHTRGQETRVAQQTFTSQQQSTNTTHRGQFNIIIFLLLSQFLLLYLKKYRN